MTYRNFIICFFLVFAYGCSDSAQSQSGEYEVEV